MLYMYHVDWYTSCCVFYQHHGYHSGRYSASNTQSVYVMVYISISVGIPSIQQIIHACSNSMDTVHLFCSTCNTYVRLHIIKINITYVISFHWVTCVTVIVYTLQERCTYILYFAFSVFYADVTIRYVSNIHCGIYFILCLSR